jgi:coiled-coil alpha-helical rod protein 1
MIIIVSLLIPEKLLKKDQQIKHEQNTIEQLRAYIGENLPNAQLERLKHENGELKGKMETIMKENETVSSTIEFLKIRLSSLNEILTIQENELNKTMVNGQKKVDNLLTRWRQKVFALLVQLKSQEICLENAKNTNKHLVS